MREACLRFLSLRTVPIRWLTRSTGVLLSSFFLSFFFLPLVSFLLFLFPFPVPPPKASPPGPWPWRGDQSPSLCLARPGFSCPRFLCFVPVFFVFFWISSLLLAFLCFCSVWSSKGVQKHAKNMFFLLFCCLWSPQMAPKLRKSWHLLPFAGSGARRWAQNLRKHWLLVPAGLSAFLPLHSSPLNSLPP